MKFNYTKLAAAALVALAAGGAQAALNTVTAASLGNSSVLFVAVDNNSAIAFAADLGLNMINLMPGAPRNAPGTTITWNFNTNTSSDSVVNAATNGWSTAYNTFFTTQAGNDLRWGLIAADAIAGPVDPDNVIAGRGWLTTGNPAQAALAGPSGSQVGNVGTYLTNYYASTLITGNFNTPIDNGAAATTSGTSFNANFVTLSGNNTWNFLVASAATSRFWNINDLNVFQLGATQSANAVFNPLPTLVSFNVNSGVLTYATPVPEPSTYAMLFAGLIAIGTMVRRRKV